MHPWTGSLLAAESGTVLDRFFPVEGSSTDLSTVVATLLCPSSPTLPSPPTTGHVVSQTSVSLGISLSHSPIHDYLNLLSLGLLDTLVPLITYSSNPPADSSVCPIPPLSKGNVTIRKSRKNKKDSAHLGVSPCISHSELLVNPSVSSLFDKGLCRSSPPGS